MSTVHALLTFINISLPNTTPLGNQNVNENAMHIVDIIQLLKIDEIIFILFDLNSIAYFVVRKKIDDRRRALEFCHCI